MGNKKPVVLLEMRPAMDGFAGIPQEVRLLFRGLRMIKSVEVAGMMQLSHRALAKGTVDRNWFFNTAFLSRAQRINRYSRVVISAAEQPFTTLAELFLAWVERHFATMSLTLQTLLGIGRVRLSTFQTEHFHDFVWRSMFSKTLPASDFELVTGATQMICQTPWHTMHAVGLNTFRFFTRPRYAKIDTTGVDIFIGQTPYPGRVRRGTALVIRYHDALPVFMPHTIPDKARHQATHFYALMSNVRSNAYFACVSDATRNDLLKLFPDAADRIVTIPNMVSHHYFLNEASKPAQVPGIIRSRLYTADQDGKALDIEPKFLTLREKENFYARHLGTHDFKYLLVVSTIEPRKNHSRLLAAWEAVKADVDSSIKLVVVGTLGWNCESLTKDFRSWIDRGELFMLNAVPAPDLRVLFRHAVATVCPSLGEGFDFSGVESMRSGGRVIASDIPVHREIYGEGAEYFNPYSTVSLLEAFDKVIYAPDAAEVQQRLERAGQAVAVRYQPEQILPQWERFLQRVLAERPSVVNWARKRRQGTQPLVSAPAAELAAGSGQT